MNEVEVLLRTQRGDTFLLYMNLNRLTKDLSPIEKKTLANYIAKRSAGVPIEQAMHALNIAKEGIKVVEKAIGVVIEYVVINPSRALYHNSNTVHNATDWVVKEASVAGQWLKDNQPQFIANQWTKLMGLIRVSKQKYGTFTQNLAFSWNEKYLIDKNLTYETFHESIPFLAEQIVMVVGTKGIGKGFSALTKDLEGASKIIKTGAFTTGIEGGEGLGKFTSRPIKVSQKGIEIIENHIKKIHDLWDVYEPNIIMLRRIKEALKENRLLTRADASFYMHEIREATLVEQLMRRGKPFSDAQTVAHLEALDRYKVSPFSVYNPDVIKSLPGEFNSNWAGFWFSELTKRRDNLLSGKVPGFNFTSALDGYAYKRNMSPSEMGTFITDYQHIADAIGTFNIKSKVIEISPKQANTLAHHLGLEPEATMYGGTLNIVEDVAKRSPRLPKKGNLKHRPGQGLPENGPEAVIVSINNTPTQKELRQIQIKIKGMSLEQQRQFSKDRRKKIASTPPQW